MKTRVVFLGFLIFLIACSSSEDVLFQYLDPLTKVFPESVCFPLLEAKASAARGEHVSFQFVVRAEASLKELRIESTPLSNGKAELGEIKAGFVDFVELGRKNPEPSADSYHSVSGFYPDPIIYEEKRDVPAAQTQPLWLSVNVPRDCDPGLYKGEVHLSAKIDGRRIQKTQAIEIEVFEPVVDETSLWVTNWIFLDRLSYLNNNEDVPEYSPLYWDLVAEFADFLSDYRQNVVFLSPLDHTEFSFENGEWKFDFSNFNKLVSVFEKAGVIGRIEGAHLGSRKGGWLAPFGLYVPVLTSDSTKKELLALSNPRTQAFYRSFLPAFLKNIEQNGWKEHYIQHVADEPIDANVESYIEISTFLKSISPNLKFIEACHTNKLAGVVDIWVPQMNYLNEDLDFYFERKEQGDELWFYTCLAPRGEYANRFIELPLLKTRLLHWVNAKYGISGYLHWGFNYWGGGSGISAAKDPFSDAAGIIPSSGNVLPGGDCWIVYPGYKCIYPSIRLEAMRDGIVDYELLKMYRQRFPDKAESLLNSIVYGFEHYDTDISTFRQKRRTMLEELSE